MRQRLEKARLADKDTNVGEAFRPPSGRWKAKAFRYIQIELVQAHDAELQAQAKPAATR